MKKFIQKIADVIGSIFGYGLLLSLLIGALSFFAYVVAIIIGGEVAVAICTFVYKEIYPHLITGTSIIVLLGLLRMYLVGETALSSDKKKKATKDKSVVQFK